jgi:hypothetical protein
MTRRLALTIPLFVALMPAHSHAQEALLGLLQDPRRRRAQQRAIEEVSRFRRAQRAGRVTITDQQTGVLTTNKMMLTSNRQWGRIRSQITSRIYGGAPLNVDARPTVTQDGRISLELTIEYAQGRNSEVEANSDKIVQVMINESLTAWVENGKPLLVTQSADPISDRKVTVEVKATIVK